MTLFVVYLEGYTTPYILAYYLFQDTAVAYAQKLQKKNPHKKYSIKEESFGT